MNKEPECGFYILEHDIIDNQKINQETINVPSCWNIEDHNKNMKVQDTSAAVDNSKRLIPFTIKNKGVLYNVLGGTVILSCGHGVGCFILRVK